MCVNHERVLEQCAPPPGAVCAPPSSSTAASPSAGTRAGAAGELVGDLSRGRHRALRTHCMGVVNPPRETRLYPDPRRSRAPGRQRGADLAERLDRHRAPRRLPALRVEPRGSRPATRRCWHAVDYLEYLIDDPATRVIALFLETVREPERFVACARPRGRSRQPVVVLKVGRSDRARRAITSHTGGLAGEARVSRRSSAPTAPSRSGELDEMVKVLACCRGRAGRPGDGSR